VVECVEWRGLVEKGVRRGWPAHGGGVVEKWGQLMFSTQK
jgi:hypothetical protein